jgi:hypothetical protein
MSIKAMKWAMNLFEVVNVPANDRCVLVALCWDHTDAGGCYPSQERISILSGRSVRRVYDSLERLETSGVIKRKTTRKGGKFQQCSYQLFGTYAASPSDKGDQRHRRTKKADGDRRTTGAEYRGIYTKGNNVTELRPKTGGVE